MIFIRYILLFIIGYLVVRAFLKYGEDQKLSSDKRDSQKNDKIPSKKVSKEIGEYIDYEEIRK